MEIKIEIPVYDPGKGIRYAWEPGFEITVSQKNNGVILIANKEGLLSLANHLLNLAQEGIPAGHHLHFDESNSLEEGSCALTIQKK